MLSTYGQTLGIFFPTLIGVPAAIVGVAFMLIVGDKLLGKRPEAEKAETEAVVRYRSEVAVPEGLTAHRPDARGDRPGDARRRALGGRPARRRPGVADR